jgi:hypothetical protein
MTTVVRRADLGTRQLIKSGGFGDVYRVDGLRPRRGRQPLAYKEFTSEQPAQARAVRMAVDLRDGLSDKDRTVLDRLSAWPCALVEESGRVCGLLMPLLPDAFFTSLIDPQSGRPEKKPRDLAWLSAGESQRRVAGVDVPDVELTDRLVLLGQLAYVIAWLHRRDWVYGDLNLHNVVFALDPARIKLLDCDSAAPLGDTRRRQGHQPAWEPPECQIAGGPSVLQDEATDVYKVGLAALRCLVPGRNASTRRSPRKLQRVLDPAGFDLMSRALSARTQRPAARELYSYLHQAVLDRTGPPRVTRVGLESRRWPRGQDLRVNWVVAAAAEAVITTGNRRQERVDVGLHATGYTIRPEVSGPVVVEFRNRYGTATADLGELRLFELPPFSVSPGLLPAVEVSAVVRRKDPAGRGDPPRPGFHPPVIEPPREMRVRIGMKGGGAV